MAYTQIYWIPTPNGARLGVTSRPRAGDWLEDEVAKWSAAGVNAIVSLLEAEEVAELGLEDEARLCFASGVDFISFPIPDRGVPASVAVTSALVHRLCAQLADGKAVVVHCRAGIGRSSLVAACILISVGIGASEALDAIASSRGLSVPDTETQREWAAKFQHDNQFERPAPAALAKIQASPIT